jgi:hypothetical protein
MFPLNLCFTPRDRGGASIRRHSGAMQSSELRCAIAHLRISRFRVRFAPRNDGFSIALFRSPQERIGRSATASRNSREAISVSLLPVPA